MHMCFPKGHWQYMTRILEPLVLWSGSAHEKHNSSPENLPRPTIIENEEWSPSGFMNIGFGGLVERRVCTDSRWVATAVIQEPLDECDYFPQTYSQNKNRALITLDVKPHEWSWSPTNFQPCSIRWWTTYCARLFNTHIAAFHKSIVVLLIE